MTAPAAFGRAVVSAAGNGIGRAIALRLAAEGVRDLWLLDRDAAGLDATAQGVQAAGAVARTRRLDLTDAAATAAVAAAILAEGAPEVLVNAVGGGARGGSGPFLSSVEATWAATHDLSVTTAMRLTRALAPAMVARGTGRIVMIASDVAKYPAAGMVDYTAAKSALVGFAKALALELAATGVTVNAVCPGAIDTAAVAALPEAVIGAIRASIPMGRLGRADEVAGLVAWLGRPEAGYVTGQAISINGGRSM